MNQDENKSCWFHSNSLPEKIDEILKTENLENGTFLIIPNTQIKDDFILSVLHENEVFHYQIQRITSSEDPFYSLNGTKIFHGLDTLIDYYTNPANITSNALIAHLTNPAKGESPPSEILCHGRTNLLHTAITKNDEKKVLELLKEENRNIDSRDQDDLTAAHLACLYECNEKTLKCLLKASPNLNLKDKSGNTPLHYACRSKSSTFIKALIDTNANIHIRNSETGTVPLHDAAKFGNMKAIHLLLKAGAANMPRTKLGQFPLDLAIEAGHFEIAEYIKRFSVEPAKTKRINWYHGTLDRQEANQLVQEHESNLREKLEKTKKLKKQLKVRIYANIESVKEEGTDENNATEFVEKEEKTQNKHLTEGVFLIRQSVRSGYALSLWSESQVKHFIISESIQHFYLDDGPFFPSLEHLVQHYSQFPDGLPINLRFPVPPKSKPPLPLCSTMPKSNKRQQTKSLNAAGIPDLPEKKSNRSPLRYFSHPGDESLKRIGGVFERSPTPSSSSGNSSNNQLDESCEEKEQNKSSDISIFASLRFARGSPKKNFIIDGMRSLRKPKNKSPKKEDITKTRSVFHDVDDLIKQQQENDPEFNIRAAKSLMKDLCFSASFVDSIYKVPTNNRSIAEVENAQNKCDDIDEVGEDNNTLDEPNDNLKKSIDKIEIEEGVSKLELNDPNCAIERGTYMKADEACDNNSKIMTAD